jgi:hypothetical protein
MHPPSPRLRQQLTVAAAAGALSITIGTVVLLGWTFGLQRVLHFPGDPIVMLPNTAVAIVVAGLALILLRTTRNRRASPGSPGLWRRWCF